MLGRVVPEQARLARLDRWRLRGAQSVITGCTADHPLEGGACQVLPRREANRRLPKGTCQCLIHAHPYLLEEDCNQRDRRVGCLAGRDVLGFGRGQLAQSDRQSASSVRAAEQVSHGQTVREASPSDTLRALGRLAGFIRLKVVIYRP